MKTQTHACYMSKSGNVSHYEIVARKDGRTMLRSHDHQLSFWVDDDKLLSPDTKTTSTNTRTCWECGREFTYWQCKECDGDWSESYCGC